MMGARGFGLAGFGGSRFDTIVDFGWVGFIFLFVKFRTPVPGIMLFVKLSTVVPGIVAMSVLVDKLCGYR
jgi:hypothetical protein